jgi:hypothetical protein
MLQNGHFLARRKFWIDKYEMRILVAWISQLADIWSLRRDNAYEEIPYNILYSSCPLLLHTQVVLAGSRKMIHAGNPAAWVEVDPSAEVDAWYPAYLCCSIRKLPTHI